MGAVLVAIIVMVCLSGAALGMMYLYPRLAPVHRGDETNTVVRLVANIFVVMTSLVFGLMINSAKNTFETIDNTVHSFATDMIILDRTLRSYGPDADPVRLSLLGYVTEAITNPTRINDALHTQVSEAAQHLDDIGAALAGLMPDNRAREAMLLDARQQYHRIVEQRWRIVEQSEGVIPAPIMAMLTAWMTLIFAGFGYRAPTNMVVVSMFLVSAALIAVSVYLVLDMDIPFDGLIEVSDAPLRRALAEIRHLP